MKRRAKPAIEALESAVGYVFTDRQLLEQALTHVSASMVGDRLASYQRLEFLGDRVLGLAIADLLFGLYPEDEEGGLSRRLSSLVRKETCAEIANEWDLGSHLRLGLGESQTGGRKRMTILGDACEAMIGAIYRDGGYAAAKAVVEAAWSARLAGTDARRRDAKTDLQEWGQSHGLKTPVYRMVGRSGPDHAPVFVVAAEIDTLEPALGEGPSKRQAEQAAAAAFLRRERVWSEEETEHG
jgi:ribonuclease III